MSHPDPVTILLVDDQPSKLMSYEVVLADLGETLIKAGSAREALEKLLRHDDIAIVLIDVQMPELDGFELAAMIREHPRFAETALIFVSAIHLSDFDRIRGYQAGAVDYVPVPVVPEVLRAKVRVFAELRRKTRQLARLNAELEARVAERTADLEESSRALRQLNDELEARIETRTAEREQAMAQLFEAQKLDTIGRLTGGVAHDFNNLLMAVLGSLELLERRLVADPAALRLVRNAIQGAERGASLTQRLLAFARRQDLRPRSVDVAELACGLRPILGRAIGPGVRLVEEIEPALPPVLIDSNQLELALLNLVVNASDAMPRGGTIRMLARPAAAPGVDAPKSLAAGNFVVLTVADEGVGMDGEVLARATEPFFTTKGVGKGTGLGLSMVQGLATQSGGALTLVSRKGQGAQVDLWLPQAEAPAEPRPADQAPAIAPLANGARRRILVVDDDPLVAASLASMLEDLGHAVAQAESAADALALIGRGDAIDLVITDHAMPDMSGLELARRLETERPGLPVVLATGYADLPGNAGLDLPRLAKPFAQRDLARIVGDHSAAPQQALAG